MASEATSMGVRHTVQVGDIATRVNMAGAGVPVVLLHGSHMGAPTEVATAGVWQPVFNALAQSFEVIAPDRLGQGFTDNPGRPEDYTLQAGTAHIRDLLRQLGKGPYHLIGHDEGAFIAAQLAFEDSDLVRSVTLVSANSLTPGSDRRNVVHSQPVMPVLSRPSLRWIYETSCHSNLALPKAFLDEADAVALSGKNAEAVEIMSGDAVYYGHYVKAWTAKRAELHRRLHDTGLPRPTLMIWGLNDPVAPFENAKYLFDLLTPNQRDTELRVFNTAGYYPFWEHPEAFSRAVTLFMEEHSA